MRGCGNSHGVAARLWLALASLAIASCSNQNGAEPVDGAAVLDEDIQLVRGEKRDSAEREIRVDTDATFVVFVHEEDCDVTLRLTSSSGAHPPARFSEVNNSMMGESLEVATLDVLRGARLTMRLESAHDSDVPCHSRARVLRFEETTSADPRVAERLAALRAWASATYAKRTSEDTSQTGFRDMDIALAHLESPRGDRWLAAWARLVRADLNYIPEIDFQQSVRDARRALSAFSELGDARNAARSRYSIATALIEIATDAKATDPSAQQAADESQAILKDLVAEPAFSASQRARSLNVCGVRAFNLGLWSEAESWFRPALDAFRALGDRQGQQMALANLGTMSNQRGEFQAATQYFDELIPILDQVALPRTRVLLLYNAALADVNAGYVDRAIERLMLALELSRELKEPPQDARLIHMLGHAYWGRGDLAQATAFFRESLRLRRTFNDPRGLTFSLRSAGSVAREAGRVQEALQLHGEALELAIFDDMRLPAMRHLALDFAAIPDYARAIAICREALALRLDKAEPYKREQIQVVLGDLLLRQPGADSRAVDEAETLIAAPLDSAIRRYDITQELAAREVLARVLAARGKWGEARTEYERAVGLMFRYSSASTNPELQASAVAGARSTLRGYVDLLMRDAVARSHGKLRPASVDEVEVLRILEWARATSFTNARTAILNTASNARVDALLAQMAGKRVRIAALQERTSNSNTDVEQLQLDIARLRAQIDRIRGQSAQPTVMSRASFMGAPALPALAPGLEQWSYAFGNEHVYLWIRDGANIRVAVLSLRPAELERQVGMAAWQTAQPRLAEVLLPDGAARSNVTSIEIVADGALASVPFGALREPDGRAVSMIGSMFPSSAETVPRSRSLRFVGVAGSSGGNGTARGGVFPTLAATQGEARSIATLFERPGQQDKIKLLLAADGNAATLASLWRVGIDVLHVATHGLADLRQPMTSLLMLPAKDSEGNPTYLTAGQVQQWRGDADLVYLSACETAVGRAQFADGVPGLQRAFLRAGARGVIATLWPVEDVYASQFAVDFYRSYTAGTSAAQALARTQLAWSQARRDMNPVELSRRRMTAWAHAYYTQ